MLLPLAMAACHPEAVVEPNVAEVETGQVVEPSPEPDPGKLVIYSGRKESFVAPLIEQFQAETGIEVKVIYAESSDIASVILQEWGNSQADLFYAQDPGNLGTIADAGYLDPMPAEIMAQAQPRFQGPEGNWVGISSRARVVVYNTDALSPEDLPETLEGFTDPKWKGKIGWPPTNGSFQVMVTAMRASWGEEKTREWLKGIQANAAVDFPKNTSTVEAVGAGQVEVGFVNHYYLYRLLAEKGEDFAARNHFLTGGGPGSLVMVSGAAILNSSQNRENAEKFLNFLLSETAQRYFVDQNFEYPVVEGITSQNMLTPFEELEGAAINLPLNAMSDIVSTNQMLEELGIIVVEVEEETEEGDS